MRILRQDIADRLLPQVRQPAQYCGLEHNRCCGDVRQAEVTVVLAFPDAYTIGISHLGTQILYTQLNAIAGVACDRSYCPLGDAERIMRQEAIPLFGWESRAALADFDIVGFSLSYELVFTNVLTMLDLAGIPIHSARRSEADPLIVAGGTQSDTPEVMSDFVDIFLVGDGEGPLPMLVELFRRMKREGADRADILLEAARSIPAAYVPSLWSPQYGADGTLDSLAPTRDDLPRVIRRSCVSFSDSPAITHPLVPVTEGVFDRISIEIMRG
ncbi:MAG: B12-binding domain-containing radical SAM protein, partial [Planctomycetes bacterium]|nr:B12-binding domain-containing radical SAM protein [Planctomycetota bacterium]